MSATGKFLVWEVKTQENTSAFVHLREMDLPQKVDFVRDLQNFRNDFLSVGVLTGDHIRTMIRSVVKSVVNVEGISNKDGKKVDWKSLSRKERKAILSTLAPKSLVDLYFHLIF